MCGTDVLFYLGAVSCVPVSVDLGGMMCGVWGGVRESGEQHNVN